MTANPALDAAVLLLGAERGHALIGCDWGTKVGLPDDREVCISQARSQVVLHDLDGKAYTLKVCDEHAATLMRATNPHNADSSAGRP